jgi:SAM-dependent methyltransferase
MTALTIRQDEQKLSATAQCPVCGGRACVGVTAEDHHYGNPGTFSIHHCDGCGHMFQDPVPNEEQLAGFYPENYYSFQVPETDLSPRGLRHRGVWLAAYYARLWRGYRHLRLVPNPLLAWLGWFLVRKNPDLSLPTFVAKGSICDFGCGSGSRVAVMKYLGWKASGIDISQAAVAAGRRAGLEILQGSTEILESRPEDFDIIVASHSVEHIPDAARLFRAFFTALKPGGTLIVEVPNAAAAALDIYGNYYYYLTLPVHLNIFSPRSLELTARRHGFSDIALRTISHWRTHAESWLVRRNDRRTDGSPRFNTHKKWAVMLARVPAAGGFLRSLRHLRGDCLQLVCRRPATERS